MSWSLGSSSPNHSISSFSPQTETAPAAGTSKSFTMTIQVAGFTGPVEVALTQNQQAVFNGTNVCLNTENGVQTVTCDFDLTGHAPAAPETFELVVGEADQSAGVWAKAQFLLMPAS